MTLGLAFFLIAIALQATALFIFWLEPLFVLPVLERLTPNLLYRVRIELPLVAFSFDDGPHPEFTPQVLDILESYDAKATFFLIGERALRHPDLLVAIQGVGHEVGNHYFKNGSTLAHSDAVFLHNLEQTEAALGLSAKSARSPQPVTRHSANDARTLSFQAQRETPLLFRPPGGLAWPRQIKLARQRGYTCVLGCAYPHDPMHPPVQYIRWLVEKNLVPGTIVILHDGISDPTRTLQALPHILESAHKKGLRVVSIGELLRAADSFSL